LSDVYLILLIFSVAMTLLFAVVMAVGICHLRSLRAALENPAGGWCVAGMLFFGILALVSAVPLSEQTGVWRNVTLVVINLLVQPVCGLMLLGCGHQFIMGMRGHLACRFRIVPREVSDATTYRRMVRSRAITSLLGVVFFGGLSAICLWPLL
jgi:hypothetical protein